MNLTKIVATWPVVQGWSVAPPVAWCAPGTRLRVGEGVTMRRGCTLLDYVKLGARVRLEYGVYVGAGAVIDDNSTLGDGVYVGALARIGDYARIGRHAFIGPSARVAAGTVIGADTHVGAGDIIGSTALNRALWMLAESGSQS